MEGCLLSISFFYFSPIYVGILEITGWQLLRRIDVGMKNKRVGILWSWQGDWDFSLVYEPTYRLKSSSWKFDRYRIIVMYVLIFLSFVLRFDCIFVLDWLLLKTMEEVINKFINNTIRFLLTYWSIIPSLSLFIIYNFQIISFCSI